MSWQNSWALLGLLLLALPLFIHLLSRKRAVRRRFPSLRFLHATRLLPTRSPHLTDIPLLLVRLAILAIAAFALTQPVWLSAARSQAINSTLARAIIVDTSASMMHVLTNGRTARDSALSIAARMATESEVSILIQAAAPAQALAGASAWLEAQRLRGEVVVLSDFQLGTIDSASLRAVPPQLGVQLVRTSTARAALSDSSVVSSSGRVEARADSVGTTAQWTAADVPAAAERADGVVTLEPLSQRNAIAAARRAAGQVAPQWLADSAARVAIVFDGAAEQKAIASGATAPKQAWMAAALLSVRRNDMLLRAASDAAVSDTAIEAPFAVIATTAEGHPVVYVAEATVNGENRLVFFHRGTATSFTVPALLVSIDHAVARQSGFSEHEPAALTDAQLTQLSRAPDSAAPETDRATNARVQQTTLGLTGLSDARWFWLLALVLLGVETFVRSRVEREVAAEGAP